MVADGTLHVIPQVKHRRQIIKEAHNGKFGGYLQDTNVFTQISRSYWLFDNGVEVSKLNSQSIRVTFNCVHLCPAEKAVTDCDNPEEYIVTSVQRS